LIAGHVFEPFDEQAFVTEFAEIDVPLRDTSLGRPR
jgi:hypothetical protein